jgi:hypothetical protein
MTVRFLIVIFCLNMIAVTPAASYEGMKADYATCTETNGTNEQIVQACTRLIDNAATENELVGFFYGLRASHNDNKQSNCRDGHKVLELVNNPNIIKAAETIIENNC